MKEIFWMKQGKVPNGPFFGQLLSKCEGITFKRSRHTFFVDEEPSL